MKMPISIIEKNGDTSKYFFVQDAEMEMEPLDVENGEYVVADADGRQLSLKIVMEDVPILWGIWKTRIKKVRIVDFVDD